MNNSNNSSVGSIGAPPRQRHKFGTCTAEGIAAPVAAGGIITRGGNFQKPTPSSDDSAASTEDLSLLLWCSVGVFLLLYVISGRFHNLYITPEDNDKAEQNFLQYLSERWSREGDAIITKASNDASFTQHGDGRIYFRVMNQTFPIKESTPPRVVSKVSLPEVSSDNRWRGDLKNATSEAAMEWRNLTQTMQCAGTDGPLIFHLVAFLSSGVRFVSTYVPPGKPEIRSVGAHIPCLNAILPLMCKGDKWEIICPPEMAFGSHGFQEVPPSATTIWQVLMLDVTKSGPRTRAHVQKLLAAATRRHSGELPITRRELYERAMRARGKLLGNGEGTL